MDILSWHHISVPALSAFFWLRRLSSPALLPTSSPKISYQGKEAWLKYPTADPSPTPPLLLYPGTPVESSIFKAMDINRRILAYSAWSLHFRTIGSAKIRVLNIVSDLEREGLSYLY